MKFVRAICVLVVAYALIYTLPAAQLDVVSSATKAKPKPAPKPATPKPAPTTPNSSSGATSGSSGSGESTVVNPPVAIPPPNTSVSSARLAIPAISIFRVISPQGLITYETMTDEQAKQRLAALLVLYHSDDNTVQTQKKEWEKACPGDPYPVPALPTPRVLFVKPAPADQQGRTEALNELRKQPSTWTVIEVTDNGTTEVRRIPDETLGVVKNQLFEKHRTAILAEKKRQEDNPGTEAVNIPMPTVKIAGMLLSEEEATTLVTEREAALKKSSTPAAVTTPAAAE